MAMRNSCIVLRISRGDELFNAAVISSGNDHRSGQWQCEQKIPHHIMRRGDYEE